MLKTGVKLEARMQLLKICENDKKAFNKIEDDVCSYMANRRKRVTGMLGSTYKNKDVYADVDKNVITRFHL